jgi:sugar phosphate isomerase/epimerase
MRARLGISVQPQYVNGDMRLLDKELRRVESAGARCCELVLHGLDVVVGGRLVPVRVKRVLEIIRERDLEYTLHLPYDLNLLDQAASRVYTGVFKAAIEFARLAGMGVIVFHAGTSKTPAEGAFRREAEAAASLAQEAGDILLCMENPVILSDDVFSAGKSAESMARFCETANLPNLRLTFDVGHYFLRCHGDEGALLSAIKTASPHIAHVHLHDNFGLAIPMAKQDYSHRLASGAADLHLPLGWGKVPVREVLEALSGFEGIINLEIEKRFEDQFEASLELAARHLAAWPLQRC